MWFGKTCLAIVLMASSLIGAESKTSPNIVLIVCDNLGYGDVGCFGSTLHRTPHLDAMAAEGLRLTSFYVASGVCTPSRAAIMTGCYPQRVGLHWTEPDGQVLRPVSPNGLSPSETTIAEVLKTKGYVTACIGKWHLGDQLEFLPNRQGFDSFFGIPYSDDMTPRAGQNWPLLPLMENNTVIEAPVDRDELTRRYTERAIEFVRQRSKQPFFLYLPHAMPGSTPTPYSSQAFRGKSRNGAYGDSIEELDWSTGQILRTLREKGIAENTLVIWTSDNGAPYRVPPQGSNRPWGGWGYTTTEGAMRVPALAWWPGTIRPGRVSDDMLAAIDLLPTFAELAGADLPKQVIDGKNITSVLLGTPQAQSPHEAIYYYSGKHLDAVRSGSWKLFLRSPTRRGRPKQELDKIPLLIDLASDFEEQNNLAAQFPEIVVRLQRLGEKARAELGDGERTGQGQRAAGRVALPVAQKLVEK